MDSTDRKEHPRGLSPTDRKNFHLLMESIFELYKKMPIHDDPEKFRKLIGGCDEKDPTHMVLFFKGNKREFDKIINYIKKYL